MHILFRSLRSQLGVIFIGFLLLVIGSTTATFLGLQAQASDALVINLAGRQRMLIQQMTKDALEIEKDQSGVVTLQEADNLFDTTLSILINGGQASLQDNRVVEVPAAYDPATLEKLRQVQQAWSVFRQQINQLILLPSGSPEFADALRSIERSAPELSQDTDEVVRLFESASAQKTLRLQWLQTIFLIVALALLATGALTTQRLIISPLRRLACAAERIGQGDLITPVQIQSAHEMMAVSQSLDVMRSQLFASQEALRRWAEELEARVAQRTRELVALYEVSHEISSRLDINYVLRSVTEKSRELLGGDIAALCLLDKTEQSLNLRSVSGPENAVNTTQIPARSSLGTQVLAADRALVCGSGSCQGTCTILHAPFQTSRIAAPLRVGDHVIGALCVGSQQSDAFSSGSVNLLTKLANVVAVALENARLYEQVELMAMLEERQRIAAEMHDGLAQTLSYLGLQADQVIEYIESRRDQVAIENLESMRQTIGQTSHDVREAIAHLQESPPPRQSFHVQLIELVHEFNSNGGPLLELIATCQPDSLVLLPADGEQVLRVIREALINAYRHAQAKRIVVRVERRSTEAAAIVEDEGRGFDPKAPLPNNGGHFGLSIMRARAARLGGQFTINSAPGCGTHITLTWPIRQAKDERQLVHTYGG